jgi:hypothetical protein
VFALGALQYLAVAFSEFLCGYGVTAGLAGLFDRFIPKSIGAIGIMGAAVKYFPKAAFLF